MLIIVLHLYQRLMNKKELEGVFSSELTNTYYDSPLSFVYFTPTGHTRTNILKSVSLR